MPWNDDSSSDEKKSEQIMHRYRLLELRLAPQRSPKVFALAIQELKECFQILYRSNLASKELKTQLFQEAMHFVEAAHTTKHSIDDRALHSAVSSMVKVAAKVMPHQRSNELSSLLKRCEINHSRDKQATQTQQLTDEELGQDSATASLIDLPSDCLELIMMHLDPFSLATLELTCQRMHQEVVVTDEVWKQHCIENIADQSQPAPAGFGWKSNFRGMAIRDPVSLFKWRYRRVLIRGRPRWAEPGEHTQHPVLEAVKWCLKGGKRKPFLSSSQSSDGESSGEEDARSKMKLWKLDLV